MTRLLTLCLVPLLLAVFSPPSALAQNTPLAPATPFAYLEPPPGEGPVRVAIRFHLQNIHRIDDGAETIDFSGILTLHWQDRRQAFDPAKVGASEKVFTGNYQFNEISPGWFPPVVVTNAVGSPDSQGVVLRVAPDGSSSIQMQVHATVRSGMQLGRMPFDDQRLRLMFAVMGFDSEEVVLVAEEGGATMDTDVIRLPEWRLLAIGLSPLSPQTGSDEFGMDSSAVVVQVEVKRRPFFMLRLVVGPLALIVLLSWSVFWMERSSLGDRMAVSFVGILTAVAYQSLVSEITPHIAYITFLNAFMVMSMLLMSATVAVNLIVAVCDKRGNPVLGDHIDRGSRWVFPLISAGLISRACLLTFFSLGK